MNSPGKISAEVLICVHRTGEMHQKIAAGAVPHLNERS